MAITSMTSKYHLTKKTKSGEMLEKTLSDIFVKMRNTEESQYLLCRQEAVVYRGHAYSPNSRSYGKD